jgi:hypothetical protein
MVSIHGRSYRRPTEPEGRLAGGNTEIESDQECDTGERTVVAWQTPSHAKCSPSLKLGYEILDLSPYNEKKRKYEKEEGTQ